MFEPKNLTHILPCRLPSRQSANRTTSQRWSLGYRVRNQIPCPDAITQINSLPCTNKSSSMDTTTTNLPGSNSQQNRAEVPLPKESTDDQSLEGQGPPPKHKMVVVTFLLIWLQVHFLGPPLMESSLPFLLAEALTVWIVVVGTIYLWMPLTEQYILRWWLFPVAKTETEDEVKSRVSLQTESDASNRVTVESDMAGRVAKLDV